MHFPIELGITIYLWGGTISYQLEIGKRAKTILKRHLKTVKMFKVNYI